MRRTRLGSVIATMIMMAYAALGAATPTVSDLTARQRYPWNGLVDISFTLSEGGRISVTATNTATGAEVPVRTLSDKVGNAIGEYTKFASGSVSLVWDAGADVPETLIETLALSIVGAPLPHGKVQLWEGGPYWAETNIGAEEPEESGLYFWWGDTVGYRREGNAWVASDGSSSNFSFDSKNTPTYAKSKSTLQSEGWITVDGVLAPEHDAAHVHWGSAWRMPTPSELAALCRTCDWTWTTQNGVEGYVVRGLGDFSASSIFLPAAGYGGGTSLFRAVSNGDYSSIGCYWSHDTSYDSDALRLFFYSGGRDTDWDDKYYGSPVRPVQGGAE